MTLYISQVDAKLSYFAKKDVYVTECSITTPSLKKIKWSITRKQLYDRRSLMIKQGSPNYNIHLLIPKENTDS
jgi:hypothetical protein